jgi:hypothetical protein
MVNSYLAKDMTPEALAQGMLLLGTNTTLRAALGSAGRAMVAAMYSPQAITENNAAVLRCGGCACSGGGPGWKGGVSSGDVSPSLGWGGGGLEPAA